MAESDKGTASPSKAKEKISELDDDISKNFLGSWSTILSSDDSSMDFKFEPVTKGKKKEFDFDKLDMDFSLDGEFDKIKSFKVDMGDLDFSSPPKTATKAKETDFDFSSPPKEGTKFKERSEGESAKSNKGKQDGFAFSFDFNEFNLKPSMKDKAPAATQASPTRLNLLSLGRNALSSLHPSPSGASVSYRHGAQSARSRSNLDKRSVSFAQETIVSDNNTKIVKDQSVREHCDATGAQMKNDLGVLSVPNDGKSAERGTISEKKKEDTKPSSSQMQSSLLPDWSGKSDNQGSENLKPKIPSLQSVRKLKMDTIVGKLSTLKVSKNMPNFSGLRISSSPALEHKIVSAKKMDNNGMNAPTKTIQLIGSGKQRSPAPSMKRKIAEASDAATMMLRPSKRVSPTQSSCRNSKEDLDGVAQAEVTHQTSLKIVIAKTSCSVEKQEERRKNKVGPHKSNLDRSLKSDSDKQSESTLEIPHEMKFTEMGVTPVMENDETIEKAEACGKELDQICSVLRKKQEEVKELLVRVLVANNKLLLLSDPMHAQKLCQVQHLSSRLISRELPSIVDPSPQ